MVAKQNDAPDEPMKTIVPLPFIGSAVLLTTGVIMGCMFLRRKTKSKEDKDISSVSKSSGDSLASIQSIMSASKFRPSCRKYGTEQSGNTTFMTYYKNLLLWKSKESVKVDDSVDGEGLTTHTGNEMEVPAVNLTLPSSENLSAREDVDLQQGQDGLTTFDGKIDATKSVDKKANRVDMNDDPSTKIIESATKVKAHKRKKTPTEKSVKKSRIKTNNIHLNLQKKERRHRKTNIGGEKLKRDKVPRKRKEKALGDKETSFDGGKAKERGKHKRKE